MPSISTTIEQVRPLFEQEWPTSAAVYLPGGAVPQPGSLFRNPTLAAAYARILDEAASAGSNREAQIEAARAAWYRGFVAEAIDRFCRTQAVMDTSGRRHRGLLRADDLASWQATVETPLTFDYHGFTLCKAGPWSQAPVALQQLALLAGFDLSGALGRGSRVRPSGGRMRQARLRRPRGVLRRSGLRRRAGRGACCRRATTPRAARW